MASQFSNYFLFLQGKPDHTDAVDLENDTIKGMLTSGLTFDPDNHQYIDDVSADEIEGDGYTAGGFLVDITVTQDNTNNRAVVDAPNVVLEDATLAADAVVLYKSTGTAGTSVIICYIEFAEEVTSTNGDFTVQWNAGGIFRYK